MPRLTLSLLLVAYLAACAGEKVQPSAPLRVEIRNEPANTPPSAVETSPAASAGAVETLPTDAPASGIHPQPESDGEEDRKVDSDLAASPLLILRAGRNIEGSKIVLLVDGDRRVMPRLPIGLQLQGGKRYELFVTKPGYKSLSIKIEPKAGDPEREIVLDLEAQ